MSSHLIHNSVRTDVLPLSWEGREYEVCVSLPARYDTGNAEYAVLYVLDGNLLFGAAADIARMVSMGRMMLPESAELPYPMPPEMIVVGVGYPAQDAFSIVPEFSRRRMYDFTHAADVSGEGLRLKQPLLQMFPEGVPYGGGESFFNFLTSCLAAELSTRYRVDDSQQILFGASAGGTFAACTMFEQARFFSHFIIASPSLFLCDEDVFERERRFAELNDDLDAGVFFSFGSRELDLFPQASIASSTTRLAEKLILRNYPNLNLHTAVFEGETHARACLSALARGLDQLFGA